MNYTWISTHWKGFRLNICDGRKKSIKLKMVKINCSNKELNEIKSMSLVFCLCAFANCHVRIRLNFCTWLWSFFERTWNSNTERRRKEDKHSIGECWMLCKCAYWFDMENDSSVHITPLNVAGEVDRRSVAMCWINFTFGKIFT